jgi:hypothetical protein
MTRHGGVARRFRRRTLSTGRTVRQRHDAVRLVQDRLLDPLRQAELQAANIQWSVSDRRPESADVEQERNAGALLDGQAILAGTYPGRQQIEPRPAVLADDAPRARDVEQRRRQRRTLVVGRRIRRMPAPQDLFDVVSARPLRRTGR